MAQDEELIGGDLFGDALKVLTAGGWRARYRIRSETSGGQMFYGSGRLGWYSTKNTDCEATDPEGHDTNGDLAVDAADGTQESHCISNGEHVLILERAEWNSSGTSATYTTVARRRVAMLDRLGSLQHDPSSPDYHDQYFIFDLRPDSTTLSGEIRAGDVFREMQAAADLYPADTLFQIGAGDTLWLISTYTSQGSDGRPWYNSVSAMFTEFNTNYDQFPNVFGPGVNSLPFAGTGTKPLLTVFSPDVSRSFRIIGRVVEPYHTGLTGSLGRDQTDRSLRVSVVYPNACFTWSGNPSPGQRLTFNGSCSTVVAGEGKSYRWDFGDGTVTGWMGGIDTTSHVFASGVWQVRLEVRRWGSTAPIASTTQSVAVGVTASIDGPDIINDPGTYTWDAVIVGGVTPLSYRWYYYRYPGPEQLVGTTASYSRYVNPFPDHVFRLRLIASDAVGNADTSVVFVEAFDDSGGGAAALGIQSETGACRPLPQGRSERQALYAAVVAAGRWPQLCRRASQP
ncbi:MAG TPA: PKD domain-containing protein [Gemmatimonadales bacterium]|nr:PKD domain-containing protein [Gemmatimonadales bacterium]